LEIAMLFSLILVAHLAATSPPTAAPTPRVASTNSEATKPATPIATDWLELMPSDEIEELKKAQVAPVDHNGQNKMAQVGSSRVVAELDGRLMKIAGYIVPAETTEDGKLKEFFLVPYFGACIHVPPPPPNQIIFVRLATPIDMTEIYDAFWLEGVLHVEKHSSDIAATAYTMDTKTVTLYE
jgi:uncharacterized protein